MPCAKIIHVSLPNLILCADSFVKVWKLSALLGTPDQCDGALQASLCNHTKSVNVVRWSKDGQFLASGSDDCYILVYKLDDSGHMTSQPFGSNSAPNKVLYSAQNDHLLSLAWCVWCV